MGSHSLRSSAAVNATVVLPRRRSGLSGTVLVHACAALVLVLAADPAAAQVAASVGLDTDYRLRGYSLTNDHPALTAQISYDDPSGFYLGVSGLGDLGDSGRFLGVIADAGYAERLGRHLTVDAGVLRSQIRSAYAGGLGYKYTEFYLGAYAGPVAARIHYSPDYRTSGQSTLYGEVEAGFEPAKNWRLSGHVGLLTYLNSTRYWESGETHRDWRITVARQFGRFELHTALSGGGRRTYYGGRRHDRTALTFGGSASF